MYATIYASVVYVIFGAGGTSVCATFAIQHRRHTTWGMLISIPSSPRRCGIVWLPETLCLDGGAGLYFALATNSPSRSRKEFQIPSVVAAYRFQFVNFTGHV